MKVAVTCNKIQPRRTTIPHLVHKAPAGASAPGKDLTRHIVLSCLPAYNVAFRLRNEQAKCIEKSKGHLWKSIGSQNTFGIWPRRGSICIFLLCFFFINFYQGWTVIYIISKVFQTLWILESPAIFVLFADKSVLVSLNLILKPWNWNPLPVVVKSTKK